MREKPQGGFVGLGLRLAKTLVDNRRLSGYGNWLADRIEKRAVKQSENSRRVLRDQLSWAHIARNAAEIQSTYSQTRSRRGRHD